ncbi:MAG: hypothetical protein DCC65_09665 [Planctomycetota bacterium]|nr:MAG: hypothetical protein DCC65_09665 [Planctomycetota bacterium]
MRRRHLPPRRLSRARHPQWKPLQPQRSMRLPGRPASRSMAFRGCRIAISSSHRNGIDSRRQSLPMPRWREEKWASATPADSGRP